MDVDMNAYLFTMQVTFVYKIHYPFSKLLFQEVS